MNKKQLNIHYTLAAIRSSFGMATIELLIAMAIGVVVLAGATLVSFGSQTASLDSGMTNVGLYNSESDIASTTAALSTNWSAINSSSGFDGTYSTSTIIADLDACRKIVSTNSSWHSEKGRSLSLPVQTIVGNVSVAKAIGGDCGSFILTDGWSHPNSLNPLTRDFSSEPGDNPSVQADSGTKATGLDVMNKIVYLTALSPTKDDFFIFNANNVLNLVTPPIILSVNVSSGLNDVDVMYDSVSGKRYAFVVGYFENGTPCGGGIGHKEYSRQLQVIEIIGNPPTSASVVADKTLSTVGECGEYPAGYSVYYYDKKVYVGTKETDGQELTIFDVSTLTSPNEIASISVSRNVNDIVVRDGLAYLATGAGASGTYNPLKIYDVDPTHVFPNPIQTYLQQVGSFTATGDEEGTSLYLLGNKLYLGMERASGGRPEFYILDITNPLTVPLPKLGQKNLGLHSGKFVAGIKVSGRYAFLGLSDSSPGFAVLDISNPALVEANPPISEFNYSNDNTDVDFEEGFVFTSNSQNDSLRIISPAKCADRIDNDGDTKVDSLDPQCLTGGIYDPEDNAE